MNNNNILLLLYVCFDNFDIYDNYDDEMKNLFIYLYIYLSEMQNNNITNILIWICLEDKFYNSIIKKS